MAQFTVNAQRFDPYKNFKFRVKWDGRYVAGVSKVGALKRTTEVVEAPRGRRPVIEPQVAGADQVRADHARARRHARHRVREVGEQGLELRLRPRRRDLAQGLPQGHHHRGLQRGRAARARVQGVPLLGLRVPGLPDLDANANAVAIQTIKLENEGWERDYDVPEPAEPSFTEPGG